MEVKYMFKRVITSFCLFVMSLSPAMASNAPEPSNMPPPRTDHLDSTSPYAQSQLQRAHDLLSTLVSDPQNYHLILSDRTSFGGEAFPANVYSDKPSIVIYQGALYPERPNDEIAFMMAHELGHIHLQHSKQWQDRMEKVYNEGPAAISGAVTFDIFQAKLWEREADLYGLKVFKNAGYSMSFFPRTLETLKVNPNIHFGTDLATEQPSSLSMKDSHFSMKERFELLCAECKNV